MEECTYIDRCWLSDDRDIERLQKVSARFREREKKIITFFWERWSTESTAKARTKNGRMRDGGNQRYVLNSAPLREISLGNMQRHLATRINTGHPCHVNLKRESSG